MAVCIPASGYQDVGAQHFGYGNFDESCSYTGAPLEGSIGVQGPDGMTSPHVAWPGSSDVLPLPYWPDVNDQSEYCGGMAAASKWQGGGSWSFPNGGGGSRDRSSGHAGRPKRRFCTSFPDVGLCRRGAACAFAHSREEISAPLFDRSEENQEASALTDNFFMFKYKTRWCPVGVQHEWHTCVYAHNYQDARRPVSIGYGAKLCPYWSKKDTGAGYSQRCPLGLRCPYSHGAKEQLYHPHYFKTVVCRDLRAKTCPRRWLCAFFHHRQERRTSPPEDVDYSQPLSNDALPADWVQEFLTPPFLPERESNRGGGGGGGGATNEELSMQWGDGSSSGAGNAAAQFGPGAQMQQGQVQQYAQEMTEDQGQWSPPQMPCIFLMPVNSMMPQGMGMQSPTGNSMMPQGMSMLPAGGVPPMSEMSNECGGSGGMQSPVGLQQLPQNWVFVPMEGGAGGQIC